MLTKQDLDNSIRETIDLMEPGVNYYLSESAWSGIDKLYQSKSWGLSQRLERFIVNEGVFNCYWNNQIIYSESIRNVAAHRAFTFTRAFAFAPAFAFALIEGNITKYKGTNNLIQYKTITEEEKEAVKDAHLEII